jgi:hypothetical protein
MRLVGSVEVDSSGLEVLDRDGCLRLLARATLGRIGFTSGALPRVLPVTFHLARERILVRIGRGGTLHAAVQDAVVAFEADDIDPLSQSGWSVAVTGVATEVGDPAEADAARGAPGVHWATSGDEVVFEISTELMSGRRLRAGPVPLPR